MSKKKLKIHFLKYYIIELNKVVYLKYFHNILILKFHFN